MILEVTDSAVSKGFDHVDTLATLHYQKPSEEQMEAMTLVMESFGMNEEARDYLLTRLDTFVPERLAQARSWVIMGFLAGLSAAQNAESY